MPPPAIRTWGLPLALAMCVDADKAAPNPPLPPAAAAAGRQHFVTTAPPPLSWTGLASHALAPIGYLLACVTLLGAASPALSAQLYKWVDERGVTNYSSQPPADPGAAKNLGPVEGNLSVYSPDPALTRAVAASRQES